ncbi:MAG TPA: PRC-barrel domain-containing protein [Thermoanaerobaculia bacterium]|nr:PRC-barrel domain-containing protein [Thermoanaerobaculia bacterium]
MSESEKTDRLVSLHEFKGFRVSKSDADIRGWDVVTADRKKIGKVHELIVDTVEMKVRYLDVDVDSKILDTKTNSHILIPIAGAQLDDDDNRVYLSEISMSELAALPPFDHRRITREFETNVASWFRKASSPAMSPAAAPDAITTPSATDDDASFYQQEHLSDRSFWGKRRAGHEELSYVAPDDEAAERERNDVDAVKEESPSGQNRQS